MHVNVEYLRGGLFYETDFLKPILIIKINSKDNTGMGKKFN